MGDIPGLLGHVFGLLHPCKCKPPDPQKCEPSQESIEGPRYAFIVDLSFRKHWFPFCQCLEHFLRPHSQRRSALCSVKSCLFTFCIGVELHAGNPQKENGDASAVRTLSLCICRRVSVTLSCVGESTQPIRILSLYMGFLRAAQQWYKIKQMALHSAILFSGEVLSLIRSVPEPIPCPIPTYCW